VAQVMPHERSRGVEVTRGWWIFLVTGIAWLIFSFIVLSFNYNTVLAIAIVTGLSFMAAGINEFAIAFVVRGWRWLHLLMGALGVFAGIVAFAWPGKTFAVLAAILAWYLLFRGVSDIVVSLMSKGADMWWLRLVIGVAEILIAFWAIGYPGRALALLAIWVGASAFTRGLLEIVLAFEVRSVHSEAERATPAAA
jgi:uncharacterized membrane protein HdeD (DUF308 family)